MSPVIVKLEVVKVKLFCLKLSNHSGKNSIECQIYRRSNIPKKKFSIFQSPVSDALCWQSYLWRRQTDINTTSAYNWEKYSSNTHMYPVHVFRWRNTCIQGIPVNHIAYLSEKKVINGNMQLTENKENI